MAGRHTVSLAGDKDVSRRRIVFSEQKQHQPKPSPIIPEGEESQISNRVSTSFSTSQGQQSPGNDADPLKKCPPEKMEYVYNELAKGLPKFFVHTHNFNLYTKDMVFEDNIRGLVIKGRDNYAINLSWLKIKTALAFAEVQVLILKMTQHPEDSTIKVRWQINGISGWRLLFTFWRYGLFHSKKLDQSVGGDTYDGFSIFYLNSEGLIYKHFCDRMIPDSNPQSVKSNSKTVLV